MIHYWRSCINIFVLSVGKYTRMGVVKLSQLLAKWFQCCYN